MSGLRTITATAVAIGLLVGSALGAAAQAEGPTPVEVTLIGGSCTDGSHNIGTGDVVETHGGFCRPSWTASDPRLDGTATFFHNANTHPGGLEVETTWRTVEDDEGMWRERPRFNVSFPGSPERDWFEVVFDGEGAYDGLIFYAVAKPHGSGVDFEGFIVEGAFPPIEESAATE